MNFRRAVEIHHAPENARHVNIVRPIDRDRIDLLVFGTAHHGHPLQAGVTVEFQQEEVVGAGGTQRACARTRIEIDLTAEGSRHKDLPRGIEREGPRLIRTRSADTFRPDKPAVRVELQDKDIRGAGGHEFNAGTTGVEIHGASERTHEKDVACRIDGDRPGLIGSGATERPRPEQIALAIELADENFGSASRRQRRHAGAGIEVDRAATRPGRVDIARRIHRRRQRFVPPAAAPRAHPFQTHVVR